MPNDGGELAQPLDAYVEPPPAAGVRLQWSAVPQSIQQRFEAWANSPVVEAASQSTGFSPGVAAHLRLADGRALFVKAVSSAANADAPRIHRREARIVGAMPDHLPVPRLRWFYDGDDETDTGWVVLAFDVVSGRHPEQPWRLDQLQLVLDGLAQLAQRLTPSPLPIGTARLAGDTLARHVCGWQRLAGDDGPESVQRLDAWSRRHLSTLAQMESHAPQAVSGSTLLHFDMRADNLLIDDDHVWFFDWPHACVGAAWFDVVGLIPSVVMQGGPPAEEVFARYRLGTEADQDAVNCALASLAGYFTRQSLLPPPPGLPTLRAFQAAQGTVARRWLAERTGLR
ncbi:MAG TPA: phosphotransferase [Chloroflexota bacterium]|nr:phosphotransferase [Chloroflexota bacterium]